MTNVTIVPYQKTYHDQLVDIWLRAVRATHHFLTEEDITFFYHLVQNEALTSVDVWIALNETAQPTGFIGLAGSDVAMLFVDPLWHGHRIGTQLLNFALAQRGSLTLDVNEQNHNAVSFYKHYGFEQVGRSELDSSGRPFPLLHLILKVSETR